MFEETLKSFYISAKRNLNMLLRVLLRFYVFRWIIDFYLKLTSNINVMYIIDRDSDEEQDEQEQRYSDISDTGENINDSSDATAEIGKSGNLYLKNRKEEVCFLEKIKN